MSELMKATLILANGSVFSGTSIGGTSDRICEMLSKNGLDRFNKYDCRYLCNDFNSTFCFYNTQIIKSAS